MKVSEQLGQRRHLSELHGRTFIPPQRARVLGPSQQEKNNRNRQRQRSCALQPGQHIIEATLVLRSLSWSFSHAHACGKRSRGHRQRLRIKTKNETRLTPAPT